MMECRIFFWATPESEKVENCFADEMLLHSRPWFDTRQPSLVGYQTDDESDLKL